MSKLSESIVGKIKCDCITPVPRWQFLVRSYAFWTFFSVSVILGSLSFSVIMHFVRSGDWDIMRHLQGGFTSSAAVLLPLFWILSLIFFAASAYLNWKCTKKGYLFKRRWLVIGSVLLSIAFGDIFYAIGLGKKIDYAATKIVPVYDRVKHQARRELWLHPEKGLLTGKIMDIDENKEKLIIRDEDGKNWIVSDLNVKWENARLEERGIIIKVVGKKTGETEFEAKEIRRCNSCQDDEFIEELPAGVCFRPERSGCGN